MPYEKYLEDKNVSKNIKYFIYTSILGISLIWLSNLTNNPYIIVTLVTTGFILFLLSGSYIVYLTWRGIFKDVYTYLKRKVAK